MKEVTRVFSTEFILAIALMIIAIIIVIANSAATRRVIRKHTKLLSTQAGVITAAKHKVQADLHKEGSEDFEKAVAENSAFIKNDLHRTSAHLSTTVEKEFNGTLAKEMEAYRASAREIGKVSADAVEELQAAIGLEQKRIIEALRLQHETLAKQIDDLVQVEKDRRIQHFETDMAKIVQAYANDALSGQIDMSAQLNYILEGLEANKAAMIEDMKHVA